MPIVIPRQGDATIQAPMLSQEQSDKIWEAIIRAWANKHREELAELLDANQ